MLNWIFQSARHPSHNSQIKTLLQQHFHEIIQLRDINHCTLLHIAAGNNPDLLQYLIVTFERQEIGDDRENWINQGDRNGNTPLHYAVFSGDMGSVRLLMKKGAKISKVNKNGLNCLHMAAQGGSPALTYHLRSLGVKSIDQAGNTALHWAAFSGMEHTVSMLITLGSDPNQKDNDGNTPLHLGATLGYARVVRRLVLGGSDPGICNKKGERPIQLAQDCEAEEIVTMLSQDCKCSDLLLKRPALVPRLSKWYPILFLASIFFFTLAPNILSLFTSTNGLSFILSAVSFGLLILTTLIYLSLRVSDPGFVKVSQLEDETYLNLLQNNKSSVLCFQCQIKRPPRSRHCPHCKRCIQVYDHHCPWINNCIGSHNNLLYTTTLTLVLVYLLVVIAAYIIRMVENYEYNSLMTTMEIIQLTFTCLGLLTSAFVSAPVGYLLVRQLIQSAQGLTTFEVFLKSLGFKQKQVNLVEKKQMVNEALMSTLASPGQSPTRSTHYHKPITNTSCCQNLTLMLWHNRKISIYSQT